MSEHETSSSATIEVDGNAGTASGKRDIAICSSYGNQGGWRSKNADFVRHTTHITRWIRAACDQVSESAEQGLKRAAARARSTMHRMEIQTGRHMLNSLNAIC